MESYERLLGAMPYIAEVVNRFRSPEVQRRAFEALLAAFDAGPVSASPAVPPPPLPDAYPNGLGAPDRDPAARPLGTMATLPEPDDTDEPDRDPAARPLGTMVTPSP